MEENLETLFSKDKNLIEKLKGFVKLLDYKELLFGHLGPELKKFFDKKRNNLMISNFLEALQYEYGLFGNKINLSKAFSLYKYYADKNDYYCMYKMHVIYLCEYEKFNVPFNRILEKLYILKCLAYFPNYIFDWDLKLFEKIDVRLEIAEILDEEDGDLEKHIIFIDLLNYEKEKYNLTENDIHLMKNVLICYFKNDNKDESLTAFCQLNSLIPQNNNDIAYYEAKNKCVYFKKFLNIENYLTDKEIEIFYEEIEKKKLYQYYSDYGNYLLDKTNIVSPKIIDIYKIASNNGHLFSSFRSYQSLINFYDFSEILNDYNKITDILNYLIEEITFEKILLRQFIILLGIIMKYSNLSEKISSYYLKYVKEINDYISPIIKKKDNLDEDIEMYLSLKGYIYFFGFKGIEKQNLVKAIELFNESSNITKKYFLKKSNEYFIFKAKESLNKIKKLSNEDLINSKNKLIKIYLDNLYVKYEIIDCFILGKIYWEGIVKKKDELNTLMIFRKAQHLFCKTVLDSYIKTKIKEFLKIHDYKFDIKYNEDICCICYDKKIGKILVPCKHSFCSTCVNKLDKNSKCPICRGEILCIY